MKKKIDQNLIHHRNNTTLINNNSNTINNFTSVHIEKNMWNGCVSKTN